jgi:hypothetical protein
MPERQASAERLLAMLDQLDTFVDTTLLAMAQSECSIGRCRLSSGIVIYGVRQLLGLRQAGAYRDTPVHEPSEAGAQYVRHGMPGVDVGVKHHHMWAGWLEFETMDGSRSYQTVHEVIQPSWPALAEWAVALQSAYVQGAFRRALAAERCSTC